MASYYPRVATNQGHRLLSFIDLPPPCLGKCQTWLNGHHQQSVLSCLSSQQNDCGNSFTSLYTCFSEQ